MWRPVRLLVFLAALTGGGTAFAADPPATGAGAEKAKFVLPRMIVAAIQGDSIVRHYSLLLRLELATPADSKRVEENLVRLQNAFIHDLNDVASTGDFFDQERARRRLIASAARVLGDPHVVENIVFERVLERRMRPN